MSTRTKDERGATAVLVGVLAILLFSVAALAVDLGNAWSRKREVQKQVDISALGAGYLLPMTLGNETAIAAEVAKFLNAQANEVVGQAGFEGDDEAEILVTAAELLNGVSSDGEVTFQDDAGESCADNCTRMTVLAPQARVDFGFAGIMGFSGTDVQEAATVEVMSALPPKQKLIPFWLPSGCGYGPADVDTTQGGGSSPSPSPSPTPTGTASPSPTVSPSRLGFPAASDQGSHMLGGTTPINVAYNGTASVTNYFITNLPNNTTRATLRFFAPDGSRSLDYAAKPVDKKQDPYAVPPFTVGTEVTNTPGAWRAYAVIGGNNGKLSFSSNYLVVNVSDGPTVPSPTEGSSSPSATPSDIPIGCVGQDRGNFGQLKSPRADGSPPSRLLERNIAGGLDHLLQPFQWADEEDVTKDCGKHTFIPGAFPDNVSSSAPPRNCIISDTGNDGPGIYAGLITGADNGVSGRLNATANGSTSALCNPSRADIPIGGVMVNNDVLSCFLRNGATLTDIAAESGVDQGMLDPRVVDSPRFVWLPMVVATDRAQKDYQPILDFVAGFITDETQTTAATDQNGLDINGNAVNVMRVFTFNKNALPVEMRSPTIKYQPSGQSIVRLVG